MTRSTLSDKKLRALRQGRFCALDQIEIQADADKIWAVLSAFNEWETWNPLYVESNGLLAEGNTILFSVALPGMDPQRGKARVLKVQPGELVQYQITSMGGLANGNRFIEIEPLSGGVCRVTNGEKMSGLMAPLLFKAFGEKVRQGLAGMNKALQKRLAGG